MANTDIKWFSFDNTNAPQLTNTWGCMIDVLDACLVTGFGSQFVSSLVIENGVGVATFDGVHNLKQFQVVEFSGANESKLNSEFKVLGLTINTIEFLVDLPDQTATGTISCKLASLGWSKAFSGTQKAVYQAKNKDLNPYFLRVDNSRDPVYGENYAKFAKVGILESCSGIDDLTGNQAPFDPSNPDKNWIGTGSGGSAIAGWFKWQHAVAEGASVVSGWFENEGASNGNRSWLLIGDDSTFYIIPKATVGHNLSIPYGFGAVIHNDFPKPFLFATNRYESAGSSVLSNSPLADPSLKSVAITRDYYNSLNNARLAKLTSGFGDVKSGIESNQIKVDPLDGYILTPFYLIDSNNYIIEKIPLVMCCINSINPSDNNLFINNESNTYIVAKIQVGAGGPVGALTFRVY